VRESTIKALEEARESGRKLILVTGRQLEELLEIVFRGPEGRLSLVAQNLNIFIRMAEGVDDDTWSHHLQNGDLSEWFRWIMKNEELADGVRDLEGDRRPAQATRPAVVEAIRERYTMPE